MDAAQIILAKGTDVRFLLKQAVPDKEMEFYTTEQADGTIALAYDRSYQTEVTAARDSYPVDYLPTAREVALKRIPELRWQKMQFMPYDDGGVVVRPTWAAAAVPMVTAKKAVFDHLVAAGLNLNPSARIKLGPSWFKTFDKVTLGEFGLLLNNHVQGCFDREDALVARVLAATGADDPVFGEIETGWPGE